MSKTQFLSELRQHLEARSAAGQLTALIIDEAQSLPYELLEEVRLLSNIETQTTKLLNVVLAGQPELSERLNDTSLRQLKQRISLRCELALFDFRRPPPISPAGCVSQAEIRHASSAVKRFSPFTRRRAVSRAR